MLDRFFNGTMMVGLVVWTVLFTSALALRPTAAPTAAAPARLVVALPTVTITASGDPVGVPAGDDTVAVAVR